MSRSRIIFLLVSLVVALPLAASILLGQGSDREGDEDSIFRYLSVFTEVLSLVNRAYVDEVPAEGLMAAALDSAPGALDPFSTYVPPEEIDAWNAVREIGPRRSGLVMARQEGALFVLAVLPGSPAATARLEPGDLISKIDDQSTRQLPLWLAKQRIAGDPGQEVEIELFRRGERRLATIRLAEFELPQVESARSGGLPVLAIPFFGPETPAAVRAELARYREQGVPGLLIDLRGVGGSDPQAAYEVAALFADGELGRLQGRDGVEETFSGATPQWAGPLVVLVDHATEGGAEILAAVLRQQAGAELVGVRTFGHAGRLGEIPLSNGGVLVLTTAHYTGPDGELLDGGLKPDRELTATDRTFADQDLAPRELIMRRGVQRLQELVAELEREAA